MRKLGLAMMMGLVLWVGVACSTDKEVDTPTNEPVEEETSTDTEEIVDEEKEPVKEEDPAPQEEEQNIIDTLKEKDMVGKNLNEVREMLGEPIVDHKDSVMHAWRYDFTKDGYKFNDELISVDVSGITEGQMEAQLFIYFEQDTVVSHSAYYLKDGEVMQYFVNETGAEEFSASAD